MPLRPRIVLMFPSPVGRKIIRTCCRSCWCLESEQPMFEWNQIISYSLRSHFRPLHCSVCCAPNRAAHGVNRSHLKCRRAKCINFPSPETYVFVGAIIITSDPLFHGVTNISWRLCAEMTGKWAVRKSVCLWVDGKMIHFSMWRLSC